LLSYAPLSPPTRPLEMDWQINALRRKCGSGRLMLLASRTNGGLSEVLVFCRDCRSSSRQCIPDRAVDAFLSLSEYVQLRVQDAC
jgi:hypothetical protein